MSLRQQAAADLASIVEDTEGGFGWAITVTPPVGVPAALVGLSTDISEVIDPETGQAVSGRTASVALRIAALTAAGFTIPVNIPDSDKQPWVVEFADINGNAHRFKVRRSAPDRALGLVVLTLEAYS